MDWELTARLFNERFEGEYLPGFSERRRGKEASWLKGECVRLREVRELKGKTGWSEDFFGKMRRVCGGESGR